MIKAPARLENDAAWLFLDSWPGGYDFTTCKGGYGFGLHGGALAIRELGGSLNARNEGGGQGATFTLDLPA